MQDSRSSFGQTKSSSGQSKASFTPTKIPFDSTGDDPALEPSGLTGCGPAIRPVVLSARNARLIFRKYMIRTRGGVAIIRDCNCPACPAAHYLNALEPPASYTSHSSGYRRPNASSRPCNLLVISTRHCERSTLSPRHPVRHP